ncbi:MAG: PIG-L deacetylase family protein [Candidatus Woesearchaeota archaeon]
MNVLVFTAHPDDEVNCAGLLNKNSKEGGKNLIVCFTGNKKRLNELKESCKIIGAELLHLNLKEYELLNNQETILKLKKIIMNFKPDVAILQANDYHLDHKHVFDLSLFALKIASHGDTGWFTRKVLEMETSFLIRYPDIIVDISEEQDIKIKAFKAHKSQTKGKSFGSYYLDIIDAKAKLRGVQIGATYGEAYIEHHMPIVGNFYKNSRGIKYLKNLTRGELC